MNASTIPLISRILSRHQVPVGTEGQRLDGKWHVTHAGPLRLAARSRCQGIQVQKVHAFCDPGACHWVFKQSSISPAARRASLAMGRQNVSVKVHGAELRIAETRAVNRALRKAYGIGLCSVKEVVRFSPIPVMSAITGHQPKTPATAQAMASPFTGLYLLIRQHNLNPTLVKACAADFCGTPSLKDANRDLV